MFASLLYAQLIIDDVEYGVHVFFLQVRDEHHAPLPGIEVGETGVKLGDLANDTGYMRLKNVRIPREHLLSKRQHVTPEGVYVKHGGKKKGGKKDKSHYAAVMGARGALVGAAGGTKCAPSLGAISAGATIAIGSCDPSVLPKAKLDEALAASAEAIVVEAASGVDKDGAALDVTKYAVEIAVSFCYVPLHLTRILLTV